MPVNILVSKNGIFPDEMAEVQRNEGVYLYQEDETDLAMNNFHSYLLNSPFQPLSIDDARKILQMQAERFGVWCNFNFASWEDYRSIYQLDMRAGFSSSNFWDAIFDSYLFQSRFSNFRFPLNQGGKIRVFTKDGKEADVESILIPQEFVNLSAYVAGKLPFARKEYKIDIGDERRSCGECFLVGYLYGQNFKATPFLQRKIELKAPLEADNLKHFKIYCSGGKDYFGEDLTDASLQVVCASSPTYATEIVGVLNDDIPCSKVDKIFPGKPAGLVIGSGGNLFNSAEQGNVNLIRDAFLHISQRRGASLSREKKEAMQNLQIDSQKTIGSEKRGKKIPFEVYPDKKSLYLDRQ